MADNKSSGQLILSHLTIGLQLAITIMIFVYGGYRLDLYFDKSPLFLAVGTVIGMALGFYHLMKNLQSTIKKSENDKPDGHKRIRKKWN